MRLVMILYFIYNMVLITIFSCSSQRIQILFLALHTNLAHFLRIPTPFTVNKETHCGWCKALGNVQSLTGRCLVRRRRRAPRHSRCPPAATPRWTGSGTGSAAGRSWPGGAAAVNTSCSWPAPPHCCNLKDNRLDYDRLWSHGRVQTVKPLVT